MVIWRYVLPTSLVVPFGINIDSLVQLALYTIFHPISTWIYALLVDQSWQRYAICITVLWIFRGINLKFKSTPNGISKSVNKSVLITGGSSGLGFEIVKQLSLDDDVSRIIVVDLNARIEFKVMEKVAFLSCDLTQGIQAIVDTISLKEIDILICNAGVRQLHDLKDLNEKDIDRIINANWISHTRLIKRYINATCDHQENALSLRRHIIVIGSVLGYVGPKNLGVYASTKAALAALMESLRSELPRRFVFSTILPGQLNSQMFADVSVNEFWAPVVDIRLLASRIVDIIQDGLNGSFAYPLYGKYLPVYKILPWTLQRFCRWVSNMDNV